MRLRSPFALLMALAVPALGACAATPPPVAVETPAGLVRGESEQAARDVALQLENLAPRVREMLIDTRDHRPEVWVQRVLRRSRSEESPATISGFTRFVDRVPLRIYLREGHDLRWALGHELVHALTGPTWDVLPGVLSEGLADVVAGRLIPDLVPQARAVRLLNASLHFGGIALRITYRATPPAPHERAAAGAAEGSYEASVWYSYRADAAPADPREVLELDRWDLNEQMSYLPESYYGIGYLVADRIVERAGIRGLYRMCIAASRAGHEVVPADVLLDAADLHDTDDWNEAIRACLGEAEVHEVHRVLPRLLPDLTVELFAPLYGSLDARTFLREAAPALLLSDGTTLPLASLDGFSDALAARWRAAR